MFKRRLIKYRYIRQIMGKERFNTIEDAKRLEERVFEDSH